MYLELLLDPWISEPPTRLMNHSGFSSVCLNSRALDIISDQCRAQEVMSPNEKFCMILHSPHQNHLPKDLPNKIKLFSPPQ